MHGTYLTLGTHFQTTFLECFQHRNVLRQHFSREFLQPGGARKYGEMSKQRRTYALLLIVVDHNESDLGCPRLFDDIAATGNDCGVAALFDDRHQSDMLREIDVHEKGDFLVGKASLCAEETTVERLRTGTVDGRTKVGLVLRPERANFEPPSVARSLSRRIFVCFQHKSPFSASLSRAAFGPLASG